MKAYTKSFNRKKELETFLNDSGISKTDIVAIFEASDKTINLVYYAE